MGIVGNGFLIWFYGLFTCKFFFIDLFKVVYAITSPHSTSMIDQRNTKDLEKKGESNHRQEQQAPTEQLLLCSGPSDTVVRP